jgi:hypothetical protein
VTLVSREREGKGRERKRNNSKTEQYSNHSWLWQHKKVKEEKLVMLCPVAKPRFWLRRINNFFFFFYDLINEKKIMKLINFFFLNKDLQTNLLNLPQHEFV